MLFGTSKFYNSDDLVFWNKNAIFNIFVVNSYVQTFVLK